MKPLRSALAVGLVALLVGGGGLSCVHKTRKPLTPRVIKTEEHSKMREKRLVVSNCKIKSTPLEGKVNITGDVMYSYSITKWRTLEGKWSIYDKIGPAVTENKKVAPSLVKICSFGLCSDANVSRDGSFDTEIIDSRLKQPEHRKYYRWIANRCSLKIYSNYKDPKKPFGEDRSARIGEILIDYKHNPDKEAIKSFVDKKINSRIFPITVDIKDQISRIPISSRIEIKCIDSPNIQSQLQREFQNEELLEIAKGYTRRYLKEERGYADKGQSVSFKAIEGAEYKIETFDPNYHYFQAVFKADASSKTKEILLIEKGSKIRFDNTKEGQGMMLER